MNMHLPQEPEQPLSQSDLPSPPVSQSLPILEELVPLDPQSELYRMFSQSLPQLSALQSCQNQSQTIPIEPPSPQVSTPLQRLQAQLDQELRFFTQEQIRLYFSPYPERQHKQLLRQFLLWCLGLGGLLILAFIIYSRFTHSQETLTNTSFFEILLNFSLVILLTWLVIKKAIPLWKSYRLEYRQHIKETRYTEFHCPPDDQQYRAWINRLGNIVYEMSGYKLHLKKSQKRRDWENRKQQTGESKVPEPKAWEYDEHVLIRGVVAPEEENYILGIDPEKKQQNVLHTVFLEKLQPAKPLRMGNNYSINSFTRLFVTRDFIAVYSKTIDVCQPERVQETAEHFYHQHLAHVSLEIYGSRIGEERLMLQQLTLMLDSGHTIPLNVAMASFSLDMHDLEDRPSDVDDVHGKLIMILHEHKMSALRSMRYADEARQTIS